MARRWWWLAVFAFATSAAAQSVVVNPRTVEFAPSADHATMLPADLGGGPVVVSYEARFETVAGAAVCAVDLGKPTPVSSLISMPLPLACVPAGWAPRYVVKVAALGPTGAGVSAASNPFASVGEPGAPGVPVVTR